MTQNKMIALDIFFVKLLLITIMVIDAKFGT